MCLNSLVLFGRMIYFCLSGADAIPMDAIFARLNESPTSGGAGSGVDKFSRAEMHSMLVEMEKENKVGAGVLLMCISKR